MNETSFYFILLTTLVLKCLGEPLNFFIKPFSLRKKILLPYIEFLTHNFVPNSPFPIIYLIPKAELTIFFLHILSFSNFVYAKWSGNFTSQLPTHEILNILFALFVCFHLLTPTNCWLPEILLLAALWAACSVPWVNLGILLPSPHPMRIWKLSNSHPTKGVMPVQVTMIDSGCKTWSDSST